MEVAATEGSGSGSDGAASDGAPLGGAVMTGVAGEKGIAASGAMATEGAGAGVGVDGAPLPAKPNVHKPIATPDTMASNSRSK